MAEFEVIQNGNSCEVKLPIRNGKLVISLQQSASDETHAYSDAFIAFEDKEGIEIDLCCVTTHSENETLKMLAYPEAGESDNDQYVAWWQTTNGCLMPTAMEDDTVKHCVRFDTYKK